MHHVKHLEIVQGSEGTVGDRCSTKSIAREDGGGCSAPGCCVIVALERIRERLDAVEELAFRQNAEVRDTLKNVQDLERLVARRHWHCWPTGPRVAQTVNGGPRVKVVLEQARSPPVQPPAELDELLDVRD